MNPVVASGSILLNDQQKSEARRALQRLWERRDLGYLRLPQDEPFWARSAQWASELKSLCDSLVVLGMGGSHWGARGMIEALGPDITAVDFWGESEPELLQEKLGHIYEPSRTHFLIISKSGNTLEIATMMNVLSAYLEERGLRLRDRCTVITEERSNPLSNWANDNDVKVIPHPQDVGGRFSIFSPVGLVPAAFADVDIGRIREGAIWATANTELMVELIAHFALSFSRGEKISVFWSYVHRLNSFLPWLEQIWAESLGKSQGRTQKSPPHVSTPLTAAGVSAQHSVLQQFVEGEKDKFFVFFRSQEISNMGTKIAHSEILEFEYLVGKTPGQIYNIQSRATEQSLIESGRSTLSIEVNRLDEFTYGALAMAFEIVIGGLGELLDLNAFDQPGVELGKKIAKRQLEGLL